MHPYLVVVRLLSTNCSRNRAPLPASPLFLSRRNSLSPPVQTPISTTPPVSSNTARLLMPLPLLAWIVAHTTAQRMVAMELLPPLPPLLPPPLTSRASAP
jgi:hypothetical protein